MNIFVTNTDPEIAAYEHCLVHGRKMPTELCQMLSTSKRMLDGVYTEYTAPNGKVFKEYVLPGEVLTFETMPVYDDEGVWVKHIYKKRIANQTPWYFSTHANHPCSVWLRESSGNWDWVVAHLEALCDMYSVGSGKVHGAWEKLSGVVYTKPKGLSRGPSTDYAMAMPDEYKSDDVALSYQKYLTAKYNEWQSREKPIRVEWALGTPDWYK